MDRYVAIGKVMRPHGIRGDVLVRRYGEAEEVLAPGSRLRCRKGGHDIDLTVLEARPHGRSWRVRFEGLTDREEAQILAGTELSVEAGRLPALPEGTYYSFQLIGLRVVTRAGEELGSLEEILETGARDVYVVRGARGEILLPSIPEVIHTVDLETGTMTVELIPGLVPDPADAAGAKREGT